jgi:Flp pilus assembly protein TadG
MVEFALIVPLLLMLIFGIIELGILFSVYVGLSNSAREGARAGSVYQYTGTPFLSTDSTAQTKVDAERQTSITSAISETLNPLIDPATVQVTIVYTSSNVLPNYHAYRSGDMLDVKLIHYHPLFFGLFGSQKITIKATSEMRIEPGDSR